MENGKTGKREKAEEGELPVSCPKCGADMLECVQTKMFNKKKKTEAVVYECSDDHGCGEVAIVTKKIVNIRRAMRKRNTEISDWPDVKPRDLNF